MINPKEIKTFSGAKEDENRRGSFSSNPFLR